MSKDESTKGAKETPGAFNAIIRELLVPVSRVFGQELAARLTVKLEKNRQLKKIKEEQNIYAHISSAVDMSISQEPKDEITHEEFNEEHTIKQLGFFEEWVDNVKNKDPMNKEEKTLTKLWHSILAGVMCGRNGNLSDIEVLRKLREKEAKLLLTFRDRDVLVLYTVRRRAWRPKKANVELDFSGKSALNALEMFGLIEQYKTPNFVEKNQTRKAMALVCCN